VKQLPQNTVIDKQPRRRAPVLVQREMENWRSPVGEYTVIFGKPVWVGISQRTGGWWNGRRLKLQLVSKGNQVESSAQKPACAEEQTG
jgi:hypothetical protein